MIRGNINDIPVDILSKEVILNTVIAWLQVPVKSRQIITLNAMILMRALRDERLRQIIQQADLSLIDGYGVAEALRKKGYLVSTHLPGVELVNQLLNWCSANQRRVAFYGSRFSVINRLKNKISQTWPGITLSTIRDGYQHVDQFDVVKNEIINENPDLLLVGLGSPNQELFLAEILPQLKGTIGIGVGGSFDVLSGFKKETPKIIRNNGFEWLFRMMQDPSKMTNLPDLIKFWYYFIR